MKITLIRSRKNISNKNTEQVLFVKTNPLVHIFTQFMLRSPRWYKLTKFLQNCVVTQVLLLQEAIYTVLFILSISHSGSIQRILRQLIVHGIML
jgi:hypothetical protein